MEGPLRILTRLVQFLSELQKSLLASLSPGEAEPALCLRASRTFNHVYSCRARVKDQATRLPSASSQAIDLGRILVPMWTLAWTIRVLARTARGGRNTSILVHFGEVALGLRGRISRDLSCCFWRTGNRRKRRSLGYWRRPERKSWSAAVLAAFSSCGCSWHGWLHCSTSCRLQVARACATSHRCTPKLLPPRWLQLLLLLMRGGSFVQQRCS